MAKWISRPTSNREIAGSTPASDLSGNLGSPNPSYEMRRVFEQLFISFAEKVVGGCVSEWSKEADSSSAAQAS